MLNIKQYITDFRGRYSKWFAFVLQVQKVAVHILSSYIMIYNTYCYDSTIYHVHDSCWCRPYYGLNRTCGNLKKKMISKIDSQRKPKHQAIFEHDVCKILCEWIFSQWFCIQSRGNNWILIGSFIWHVKFSLKCICCENWWNNFQRSYRLNYVMLKNVFSGTKFP